MYRGRRGKKPTEPERYNLSASPKSASLVTFLPKQESDASGRKIINRQNYLKYTTQPPSPTAEILRLHFVSLRMTSLGLGSVNNNYPC